MTSRERTVAIVGTASTSRLLANDEPPEVERWGLGAVHTFTKQVDRWFEIHDKAWLLTRAGKGYFRYLHFMQQRCRTENIPIYMWARDPTIPTSVEYPLKEVSEYFFGDDPPYLSSTIAYMIALAIYEKVAHIKFFGVDMSHPMEYGHQRSGVEYFIGWARSSGIKVTIHPSSPIMKAPLYGKPRNHKVTKDSLMERLTMLQQEEKRLVEEIVSKRGQLKETQHWLDKEEGLERTENVPDGPPVMVKLTRRGKKEEAVPVPSDGVKPE